MSEKELLPCPFCGSKARLVRIAAGCAAECTGCGVRMMLGSVGVGWYATDGEAAADWNRRQPSAPPAQPDASVLSILRDARESVDYHKGVQNLGHEAGKRHAAELASLIERIDAALAGKGATK